MKKIKKAYTYSRNRQIWRLLPTETGKLVIEDRDINSRAVFFNCINIFSGKKIFYDFQLDEKYWAGIEAVKDDIIVFHKYISRDMPDHNCIIVFDINLKKILWQTDEFVFLFMTEEKIYGFKTRFNEGHIFSIDYKNGYAIAELDKNVFEAKSLREEFLLRKGQTPVSNQYNNYLFPRQYSPGTYENLLIKSFLDKFISEKQVAGVIDFIELDNYFFFNYHSKEFGGNLKNVFKAIDISSKKIIFEEVLNARVNSFIPDSFFLKDKLLFLLIEKTKLIVCSVK